MFGSVLTAAKNKVFCYHTKSCRVLFLNPGLIHRFPFSSPELTADVKPRMKTAVYYKVTRISSPFFFFYIFWGSLCFPLTRQNTYFFAGVLIPAKLQGHQAVYQILHDFWSMNTWFKVMETPGVLSQTPQYLTALLFFSQPPPPNKKYLVVFVLFFRKNSDRPPPQTPPPKKKKQAHKKGRKGVPLGFRRPSKEATQLPTGIPFGEN